MLGQLGGILTMNIYEEAQDKWQLATDHWIELTLEKYKGYDIDDLPKYSCVDHLLAGASAWFWN